ncbi:redoxin domain-containing protein [Granulicella sp. WH15]|uniref:peroxiredoxin-like family protein n=1 Tax=Granulicella sp. WH15 TaxID=2602070 RepID=UPI001366F1E7|nr:redoxin domain-containing protein [Granulicella sp. WH15]QHN03168.1 redoxin domain-containing protein [Granulicella sp. WH15]
MASLLQDRLDAITTRTRALVQADRLAVSEQATADLFASGIEDRILSAGSPAPSFALTDASTGQTVRSSDLLALGPLVLSFFRGRWDPYCVTELEAWRDLYPTLRERGAFFTAVSPQTRRQNDFTAQQHGLSFPLLSDPGCSLAAEFGIMHTVPPAARRYFQSILVNIPFANSGGTYATADEASWRLPLPAVFLIRQDGIIAFAEAHADPRVRPEPDDILALL